jgi:hypothetical protein
MRTTLTLDDDVAARLAEQQRRRVPFKQVVNETLRAGLDGTRARRPARARFSTTGLNLGPSLIGSLDNIEEVLARIEGERHR